MVQSVVTEILFYQYFDVVFQRRLPLGRPLFLVFCFLSLSLLPPIFKTPEGIIAGEQILHGLLSHQREQKLSMYLSTLVWLHNLTFQIRSVVAEIFQYQYFEVVFQSNCCSKADGQVLQYKCIHHMYRIINKSGDVENEKNVEAISGLMLKPLAL